jgi:hypothetical protein
VLPRATPGLSWALQSPPEHSGVHWRSGLFQGTSGAPACSWSSGLFLEGPISSQSSQFPGALRSTPEHFGILLMHPRILTALDPCGSARHRGSGSKIRVLRILRSPNSTIARGAPGLRKASHGRVMAAEHYQYCTTHRSSGSPVDLGKQ